MVAFVANTNILDLIGLYDVVEEEFINDATVSVTLKDEDGEQIGGASLWPQTMEYVTGSDGDYRIALSYELPLVAGICYIAHIDADDGVERHGHWEFPFKPLTRRTR